MSDRKVRGVPFAAIAEARREMRGEIAAVNWLLAHYAEVLPPESATARAVARHASWREIHRLARWEGSAEIAELLEDALQTHGSDLPPDVRME